VEGWIKIFNFQTTFAHSETEFARKFLDEYFHAPTNVRSPCILELFLALFVNAKLKNRYKTVKY